MKYSHQFPVIPPPLVVLPLLELPKSPTPPPSPAASEPDSESLPTPPPLSPPAQVFIPSVEIAPPSPEPEPEPLTQPLPNRQQIRTLTKDTPSLAADKPKLTPDCKLYWIQKHLEQEQQEEEERARKRKMSIVSCSSATSEVSNEEEERRQREEEERRREAEEVKRLQEENKLREEAEKLRLYQELKAKEDARRKEIEENAKRKEEAEKEERRRLEEERRRKKKEEELEKTAAAERLRLEKDELERKKAENEEKLRQEGELSEQLISKMSLEDEEKKTDRAEVLKVIKVSGQRSKKPTMAREWRKLKEKQKHSEPLKESLVEKMEVDTEQSNPPAEVVAAPPRAKYVPPVFAENETYSDRQKTFLTGSWPHNNKKGIPTPSELAEAGFFFIGPDDYCRSVWEHSDLSQNLMEHFRCYQCGLEQMCWEPFESPWIRHGFLAPDCYYVERIKVRQSVVCRLESSRISRAGSGLRRLPEESSELSYLCTNVVTVQLHQYLHI